MSGVLGDNAQRGLQGLQAWGRSRCAEQSAGADARKRPLRSRFRARLTAGVSQRLRM